MQVKLTKDLVQRNKVAKAGDTVELSDKQAEYLISIGRAEKVAKVKEEKAIKKTKVLKVNKDTKDA
jgi:hypothetical protein